MAPRGPTIGVTVLPEFFQSESMERVLDRLQVVGVNAVTTSPYVMELADTQTGSREPPIDAGAGSVRTLDRVLWGHRELWVRTAPSFAPNQSLYGGLRYQPPQPNRLTKEQGGLIDRVIESSRSRGIEVSLQVQAAIPPGYRVQFGGPHEDDVPRLPDGRVPASRVSNNGSLASPEIIAYGHALLGDLCERYPEVDAIRVDWPEYPPYSLDDMFVDFCSHAEQAAGRASFDWERMLRDTSRFYERLHGDFRGFVRQSGTPLADVVRWCCDYSGVLELLRFKRHLVDQLLSGFRDVVQHHGKGHIRLAANLFPWPWSLVSGADYECAARHCSELAIKLYGMHWKMMFRSYCDQLAAANTNIETSVIVETLLDLFDFMDLPRSTDPIHYSYPGPEQSFGVSGAAQRRKLVLARDAGCGAAVRALVHAYGPAADFRERLEIALESSPDGIWINRYGYLSDEKLAIVGELCQPVVGGTRNVF